MPGRAGKKRVLSTFDLKNLSLATWYPVSSTTT